MDKMFIANRITELRLKKNVSEYQMSLDLGRNKSYIQSLSSGRNNPTMENFLEDVYKRQAFDLLYNNSVIAYSFLFTGRNYLSI